MLQKLLELACTMLLLCLPLLLCLHMLGWGAHGLDAWEGGASGEPVWNTRVGRERVRQAYQAVEKSTR